jgi:hypothetical protein
VSTYYQFRCPKCGEQGGFFSRQAWGWGNDDIFENFKFFVAHAHCGSLEVVSEMEERYFAHEEELKWLERLNEDDRLRDHVWPQADEWQEVAESWEGAQAKWRKRFEEKLKRERGEAKRGN